MFVNEKVKNTVSWTYRISDFNGEKVVETFYETECIKQIRKSLMFKK